jgi:YVTN family beta-propeller protein
MSWSAPNQTQSRHNEYLNQIFVTHPASVESHRDIALGSHDLNRAKKARSTTMKFGNALSVLALATVVAAAAHHSTLAQTVAEKPAGGSLAATANPGYIYVSNETLNEVDVLRAFHHVLIASMPTIATPFGIAATKDGKRVYVSTFDGKNIYAFDTETNVLLSTLQFGSELREITLTPDDKYLYVPDYNENVVHIVSTKDNTLLGDIPVGTNPHMVAFGDGGKYAYVTAEAGQVVTVIDTTTATVVDNIPVGETPIGIASSPDGKTIYVGSYNAREVSFISTKTQALVATVPLPCNAGPVAASPDATLVYAVCANPSKGYAISVADKLIVGSFSIGENPRNVIVSPDGKTIYVTNFDSLNLYAIDAATYNVNYKKGLGALDGIAFSDAAKPLIENYTFKTIDYPGAVKTEVHQINENGYAVGVYVDQAQAQHGFIYYHGEFVNYDFPGGTNTQLADINSSNLAVGSAVNSQGYSNGFELFDGVGGVINLTVEQDGQSLTVPSATVEGIDDDGSTVGVYYPPPNYLNTCFRLDGFAFNNLHISWAEYTQVEGVTGSLVIGWFIDGSGNFHGLRWERRRVLPVRLPRCRGRTRWQHRLYFCLQNQPATGRRRFVGPGTQQS